MEVIFGEIIGCGLGSDSIMLRLLRSSMDKAHEDVQSTEGSIELLNARSKFYELAMILVEGCSKLIQEKAEVSQTNRDKMLSDLMESRDVVKKRLKELKFGIVGKDREMMESVETECRLRQTMELRGRELVSLQAKLEEKEEFLGGGEGIKGGGDICDLKNSVDQQVSSIKQRLEEERRSFTGGNEFPGKEGFEMTPENPEQKMIIEQMSSDIDGLKGTLDLAFGRMQNTEMRPLEKQWRWEIEKETMLILFKGFITKVEENLEVDLERRGNRFPIMFLNENWGELVNEITNLHRELEALCSSNEVEVKRVKGNDSFGTSTKLCRASSEPLPECSFVEEPNEDQDGDESDHHVAKMIKSHESIIRRQREELNRLKREILREKETSFRRLKDPNNLETRTQEVVARLDNFIKWNAKIGDKKEGFQHKQKLISDCLEDFDEKVGSDLVCYRRETDLNEEIRRLKEERDDSNLQSMMMEETCIILFKGLMKDFNFEKEKFPDEGKLVADCSADFGEKVGGDSVFYIRETDHLNEEIRKLKQERDDSNLQTMIMEETYVILLKGFKKDFYCELENLEIECVIRDDIFMNSLREIVKEWKTEREAYSFENLIRQEIYDFVIIEAAKDAYMSPREIESPNQENLVEEGNVIQTLDSLVKCVEVEEDLMVKASCEIKEHSLNNELVASECEEVDERDAIEWLLTEEETTFHSVSNKLDKALQQLFISKALLRELQESLCITGCDVEKVDHCHIFPTILGVVHEKELTFCQATENQIVQLPPCDLVLSLLRGFQQMLVDFEGLVNQKMQTNSSRYLFFDLLKFSLKSVQVDLFILTRLRF
ncbi:WPP domain-associated protein [Actinidia chinensis var. chinensis]|uniref:WPP domain-associated protein n=1 Tax=Actinidia chinensis var. chinensis TaxID=1590841 RepID=A0A2R6QB10_ACTCC|nr:WPP domain-associated protein [Actinidia chinensis var. chinensis]